MSAEMRMLMSQGLEDDSGRGDAEASPFEKGGQGDFAAGKRRAILIVDGDPQVRGLIARVLDPHFADVLCASNAADAEGLLETRAVTHVVCDGELEDGLLTAHELLAAWQRRFPSIVRAIALAKTESIDGLVATLRL